MQLSRLAIALPAPKLNPAQSLPLKRLARLRNPALAL